jgi:hypothetical protein
VLNLQDTGSAQVGAASTIAGTAVWFRANTRVTKICTTSHPMQRLLGKTVARGKGVRGLASTGTRMQHARNRLGYRFAQVTELEI